MSVQKEHNLNYCKSWMEVIENLADIEKQKQCWFSLEAPEGCTYEEEVDHLISISGPFFKPKYRDYLNRECQDLLHQLVEQVRDYDRSPDTYLNGCSADSLFSDPKWLSIVELAKQTYSALQRFRKEVTDGSE